MFVGAVFLSHSPLITGIKSEGKGDEYEEMLSRQLKHPHHERRPEPRAARACQAGPTARRRPAPRSRRR